MICLSGWIVFFCFSGPEVFAFFILMKRTLLQITLEEESENVNTVIDCDSPSDIIAICDAISELCNRNVFFAETLSKVRFLSIMKKIKSAADSSFPDFNEILKKAKIDPNNHIKEN